ncbi:MAG: hypothetical protein ABIG46_05775 [Candidatus Omnitrophota bacterium]|nr:hypothetical protein [Candidatus Omnitrophota bacterium]
MIRGGKGGAKTAHSGLRFESRVAMQSLLAYLPDYSVKEDNVYFKNEKVAEFYGKNKLYKNLLEANNIDYSDIISKKLLPDEAILILTGKTLYIIEIKFQEVSGSVDEKLQTCDFKNRQYNRLLAPLGIKVKYVYILNEWFKKPEYKDVLKYVDSVGCYYFFYELPLSFLGLPEPVK